MTQFCDYELIGELGRGGMGAVYRARRADGRVVALKVMRPELRGNTSAEERFRRAPTLYPSHPNIVQIYDAGECNGTLYFAMQLVEGESLAAILQRVHRFSPEQYTPVLNDVSAALDAAHAHGVIHRDIKPSNILVRTSDGSSILTDFDIAKNLAATQFTTIGGTGQIVGTAQYMSPEQAGGKPITPASDVYALGAMTYELLAGRPPFVGDNEFVVARMHLQDTPVDLHKVNPGVSPSVSRVVMRALRKDPRQRYPSAGSFAKAYGNALNVRSIVGIPARLAVGAGLAALVILGAVTVYAISNTQNSTANSADKISVTAALLVPSPTAVEAQVLESPSALSVTLTPAAQATNLPATGHANEQPTSTLLPDSSSLTPSPTDLSTADTSNLGGDATPTPTYTPKPTRTPKPTKTPTSTPTPTPTDTPTPTLTPSITPTRRFIIVTIRPIFTRLPVLINPGPTATPGP